jgi:hypothetical protein
MWPFCIETKTCRIYAFSISLHCPFDLSFLQRLLGIQMATFRLYLVCHWSCDEFEVYKEGLMHLGADDSS